MIESSEIQQRGHLSWRWHAGVFFAILAFACLLLWGVYQPVMRHQARVFMERGDVFLERGKVLQSNPDTSHMETFQRLEKGILTIYSALKAYEGLTQFGWPSDPEHPQWRKTREEMGALKPVLEQAILDATILLEASHGSASFAYLITSMERLFAKGKPRIDNAASELVTGTTIANAHRDAGYLHYVVLPDFIESARRIQALYYAEGSFDMAMDAYFFASALARDWTEPRLRLAALYQARQWPEFAMLECLKVIKLDPVSADADRAREILMSYDGQHPEADYYIGLSHFFHGDRTDGTSRLRRFVARHPLIPNAPKAYNLLNHIDRGHGTFIKAFLRDEIWI